MKYRLLWLPLALAACSQSPQGTAPAPGASAAAPPTAASSAPPAAAAVDASQLSQYHWQLTDATDSSGKRIDALFVRADKPVELSFNGGRFAVSNACNAMGGRYTLNQHQLQISPMMSTMMACSDPALAALDGAISQRLQGNLTISQSGDNASPQLQLVTAGGDTLHFTGQPTAETRYGGPGETVFFEVAAQTVPCNHPLIPNKQCLQVRERHYDSQGIQTGSPGDWQPLNQDIEGYTHEAGTRNVLRLKRYALKNVPADAPNTTYVLDMVVETEKVSQ
ncbi:META and DUF4377 domain-containing protein [Dyella sp. ASV21]|uniref:META and DUF4377 domain-containing protein n=1 Tax=Dyella sp. ASV21 TaxID=2795114 RepID=UPI0018EB5D7E|nr:META and DUF4377 domain-containing protein [Dyella sp. ASV21]